MLTHVVSSGGGQKGSLYHLVLIGAIGGSQRGKGIIIEGYLSP